MLDLLAAFGPFTLFFFIFGLRQLIAGNMWKASALVGLALRINWLFTGEMRWQFSVKYVGKCSLSYIRWPLWESRLSHGGSRLEFNASSARSKGGTKRKWIKWSHFPNRKNHRKVPSGMWFE